MYPVMCDIVIEAFVLSQFKEISFQEISVFNCDTAAMIASSFHLYFRSSQFTSYYVSFLHWTTNSINWPAYDCMGLHSSDGRALQRNRRGHGFESC